jgi:hypothetical protein
MFSVKDARAPNKKLRDLQWLVKRFNELTAPRSNSEISISDAMMAQR